MNKSLVITGLAQETDFSRPEKAKTVLVINKGELRIPIDETSVQQLLEYALKGYVPPEEPEEEPAARVKLAEEEQEGEEQEGEEDLDQNQESEPDEEQYEEPQEEVLDDTGIAQL